MQKVSSFKLKRFLDAEWYENEELEKLILSMNIDWTEGCLSIDDCLIEKPYAKEINGVYWQYSSEINDYEKGLNITVLTWSNGKIIVPICFMVYEKDENGRVIETKNDFALRAIERAY